MSATIALVACVSKKNQYPLPAQNIYISDWFLKASAYAEKTSDRWFILSAKYGLLSPDEIIKPYDETLNKMPVHLRRAWASKVLSDLLPLLDTGDKVIFLAGHKYRENLIPSLINLGYQVEVPMEGLAIGKQLRWLNQHI